MSNDEATSDDSPKFCSNCGNPLRPKVKFCTVCGKNIGGSPSNQSTSQPETPAVFLPATSSGLGGPISSHNPSLPVQGSTPFNPFFRSDTQEQSQKGAVSSNIRPVSGSFMNRKEIKISVGFGLTAMFSHLIRFIMIYNRFPDITTLLLPIPFYIILGFIIISANKYFMRNKGVDIELEADNYDYMVSAVFSSFFLSLMNYRFKFKPESSNIPEIVYHPQNSKQGMQYLELTKNRYVGLFVRPQAFFKLILVTTGLGAATLWWYFQEPFTNIGLIARFLAMYLGAYGVSHLAPRVGRVNEEMATVGRFRTLFLFIISFFIFLISLIGSNFFVVLS